MQQIVVVGVGVIGLSCALQLLRDGFRLALIDRDPPGESAATAKLVAALATNSIPDVDLKPYQMNRFSAGM